MADKNNTFKILDMSILTEELLNSLSHESGKVLSRFVRKEIETRCREDAILEGRIEDMIVRVRCNSISSSRRSSFPEEDTDGDFNSDIEIIVGSDGNPFTTISGINPLPEKGKLKYTYLGGEGD